MSAICGACAHPKQWSGPSHFDWCLLAKSMREHPSAKRDLPEWYTNRYLVDDHDQRAEELMGK
jgi:hypothetical protein